MSIKRTNTNLRRSLALLMSALMLLTAWVFVAPTRAAAASDIWDGTVPSSQPAGFTVSGDTYTVSSAAGMVWFLKTVGGGTTYSSKTINLAADLDFGGINADSVWSAVDPAFSGTFDGQDHTIYNYKCVTSSRDNAALFTKISGATVKNLTMENVYVEDTSSSKGQYIGAVVGYSTGSNTFENVHVNSGVVKGYKYVGGILGYAADNASYQLTMTNCSNSATVAEGTDQNGGLVGGSYSKVNMTNCYNTGAVSGTVTVGGLIGYCDKTISFTNCYNTGNITATKSSNNAAGAGGLMGYGTGNACSMTECFNLGLIRSNGAAGGLFGWMRETGTVTFNRCFNMGKITTYDIGTTLNSSNTWDLKGGLLGVVEQADSSMQDCYNWGDILSTSMGSGLYNAGGNQGSGSVNFTVNRCYNAGAVSGWWIYTIGWRTGNTAPADCYYNNNATYTYQKAFNQEGTAISSTILVNIGASISSYFTQNTAGVNYGAFTKAYYPIMSWLTADQIDVINDFFKAYSVGHKGYSQLAPENTLPAFEKAGQYGYWGAECDIYPTSDDHWVLSHDETVSSMVSGASGNISSYTLDALKEMHVDKGNYASQYPDLTFCTLEDYLNCCKKYGMYAVIEIKDTPTNAQLNGLAALLNAREELDSIVLIAQESSVLTHLRPLMPETPMYWVTGRNNPSADTIKNLWLNYQIGWDHHYSFVTDNQSQMRTALTYGVPLMTWTMDDYVDQFPPYDPISRIDLCYDVGVRHFTANSVNVEAEPKQNTAQATMWATDSNGSSYRTGVNYTIHNLTTGSSVNASNSNWTINQYFSDNGVYRKTYQNDYNTNITGASVGTLVIDRSMYETVEQMGTYIAYSPFIFSQYNGGNTRWGVELFEYSTNIPAGLGVLSGSSGVASDQNRRTVTSDQGNSLTYELHFGGVTGPLRCAQTCNGDFTSDYAAAVSTDTTYGPYYWYITGPAPTVGDSAVLRVAAICCARHDAGNLQMLTEWTDITISSICTHSGGHLTAHAATAATCTEDGNTAYWYCDACGKFFADAGATQDIDETDWLLASPGHDFSAADARYHDLENGYHNWACANNCGAYGIVDNGEQVVDGFIINTYNVTFNPTANGGYNYSTPNTTVTHGGDVTFTVTLDDAHSASTPAVTATVGDVTNSKTGNVVTYTVSNITNDTTITVGTADINAYGVTFTADGTGYTNTTPASTVEHGGSVSFTVTLDAAYSNSADPSVAATVGTVTSVKDGDTITYTVENITAATEICVGAATINSYTVKFYDKNGHEIVRSTQTVTHGQDAVPPVPQGNYTTGTHHYTFDGWSGYTNITADTDIYATFTAAEHVYDQQNTDPFYLKKAATCTDPAQYYYSCVCGSKTLSSYYNYGDPLGHDMTPCSANSASCTEPGNSAYWYCSRCEKYFSDENGDNQIDENSWVIPATGHHYAEPAATDWTWTEDGDTYTATVEVACLNCDTETDGHTVTLTAAVELTENVAATHLVDGHKTFTATATVGEQTFTATKTDVIEAAGHNWTHHDAVPSTKCTETGTVEYWSCSGCDELRAADQATVITSIDDGTPGLHAYAFESFVWDLSATPVTAQAKYVCGNNNAHIAFYDAAVTAEHTDASCTEGETTVYTASYDGHTGEQTVDGEPATGHTYAEPAEEDWTWTTSGDAYTATVVVTCPNCTAGTDDHTKTLTATVELTENVGATHLVDGHKTFTATATIGDQTFTATKTDTITAEGHHTVHHDAAPATKCTETGTIEYWSCTGCDLLFADEDAQTVITGIDDNTPGSHSFTAETVAEQYFNSAATCTAKATYFKSCAHCGLKGDTTFETGLFDYTNHSTTETVTKNAKAPGYTYKGYTGDKYCVACDHPVSLGEEIDKLNIEDNATFDAATMISSEAEADLTKYDANDIAALNAKLGELNAALAIDDNEDAVTAILGELATIVAGISELEYVTVTFTVDGETVKTETILSGASATPPAQEELIQGEENHKRFSGWNGSYTNVTADVTVTATYVTEAHTWVDGAVTLAATCMATGTQSQSCACGATHIKTLDIDANNHINTCNTDETASTCQTHGYTAGVYCDDCEKYVSGHAEKPLAAHKYTSFTYNNDATCTSDGTETAQCNFGCGTASTRIKSGTATGHAWGEWVTVKEASCTEPGSKTRTCTNDASHIQTEAIEKIAHTDANNDTLCDVCGQPMPNHQHTDINGDGKCDTCGRDTDVHHHTDSDGNNICDTCGKTIDTSFRCSFCDEYEAHRDIPFVGWIYIIVHFFIHLVQQIKAWK